MAEPGAPAPDSRLVVSWVALVSRCQSLWQDDRALGTAFAYEQHTNPLQQFHGSELAFGQPDIGNVVFAATTH